MAARVAAALSELMGGHPFCQIIGPAAVKAAVSAFEQVDIARGSRARRGSSLRARRALVGAWGHTARFLSVILCHDGIRNPFVRIRISYKKIQGLSITRRILRAPFPSAHARFSSRTARIFASARLDISLQHMRAFPFGACTIFISDRPYFASARLDISLQHMRAFPFGACAILVPNRTYFCLGALASRRPCRKRSKNSTSKMRRGTGNRPHFLVE